MKKYTYDSGPQTITVVFPSRIITVSRGSTVDLSDDEAAAIKDLPGWTSSASTKPPKEGDQ